MVGNEYVGQLAVDFNVHDKSMERPAAADLPYPAKIRCVQHYQLRPLADVGEIPLRGDRECFAADVADTSKDPDAFDGGWLGCHAIMPQVSGRKCATVYLHRVAGEFPAKARRHVLAAAGAYDAAFAAWQRWRERLGPDDACKTLDDLKKRWRVRARRRAGSCSTTRAGYPAVTASHGRWTSGAGTLASSGRACRALVRAASVYRDCEASTS